MSCNLCAAGQSFGFFDLTHPSIIQFPAGTFSNHGSSTCDLCPAGSYSPVGSAACSPCHRGEFNTENGSSSCMSCDLSLGETSLEGAMRCDRCIAGYYRDGEVCVRCPSDSTNCDEGTTAAALAQLLQQRLDALEVCHLARRALRLSV